MTCEIAAVSATRYKSITETRYLMAAMTSCNYRIQGVRYLVADASENPAIRAGLEELGAQVLHAPCPGLAIQYQLALREVYESKEVQFFLSHEAEKVAISQHLSEILAPLQSNELDMVVIGRNESAVESLPPELARFEVFAGKVFEDYLGLPPDFCSGGRAFNRKGAEIMLAYDIARGNDWRYQFFTPLDARKVGLRVGGVQIPLLYPRGMYSEEMGPDKERWDRKRLEQFTLLFPAVIAEAGLLEF